MSDSPTGVEALMLLCDSAQSVGGKLYILGGGWTQVSAAGAPAGLAMALAIRLEIPWSMANERMALRLVLVTEHGEPVAVAEQPVEATTEIEVGRPPGLRPGTALDASLAMNFNGLALEPGGYAWHLELEGELKARTAFRVLP